MVCACSIMGSNQESCAISLILATAAVIMSLENAKQSSAHADLAKCSAAKGGRGLPEHAPLTEVPIRSPVDQTLP